MRLHGRNNQHMPGEEVWLVGERRASGKRKYYLSNLPADANLRTLASAIKARWVCEQAHQQLKEELGFDHFEGRSWAGLHRPALMTMIASPSSSTDASQLRSGGKKVAEGPPPQPSLPAVRQALAVHLMRAQPPAERCPHCRRRITPP